MTRPISGFAVGIAFSYAVIARIVNQIVDQPYMVQVASDVSLVHPLDSNFAVICN